MYQKKLTKQLAKFLKGITPLKVSKFFLYTFVFLLPFQINLVVYTSAVFEGGNFNPYTSVFIYFNDFIFIFALIFWAISIFKHEYKEKLTYGSPFLFLILFLFLVAGEISVLFAYDQWLSFTIVIRLVQFVLLYFFVVNKTVKIETIINVFLASVTFQAVIAIFQYISQGSLGLSFLGESNIGPDVNGVAKIDIESGKVIRPYGTLPHPNILAGYLLTGIYFAYYKIKSKSILGYPAILLLSGAFILAFSRGAFLAFVVAALVYFSVKDSKLPIKYIFMILVFLVFFVVLFNLEQTFFSRVIFSDSASFEERVTYFTISKNIFYHNPLGIGLGNFTYNLPDFTSLKLEPWQFQPVHNAYMLMVNEIGIFGGATYLALFVGFASAVFIKMKKYTGKLKNLGQVLLAVITSLFVVGMFDHYTASLYHGLALLFLIFAICGRYIVKETR